MNDTAWRSELERLKAAGLYRSLRRVESIQGPVIEVDGQRLVLPQGGLQPHLPSTFRWPAVWHSGS